MGKKSKVGVLHVLAIALLILIVGVSCNDRKYVGKPDKPVITFDREKNEVIITAQNGAAIYYKKNGGIPNIYGLGYEYVKPLSYDSNDIAAGNQIKAVAVLNGEISDVAVLGEILKQPLDKPTLSIDIMEDNTQYIILESKQEVEGITFKYRLNDGEIVNFEQGIPLTEKIKIEYWADIEENDEYTNSTHVIEDVDIYEEYNKDKHFKNLQVGQAFVKDGKLVKVFYWDTDNGEKGVYAVYPEQLSFFNDVLSENETKMCWGNAKYINENDKLSKAVFSGPINTQKAISSDNISVDNSLWKTFNEKQLEFNINEGWFIPSIEELGLIYLFRESLDIGFSVNVWSSSEDETSATGAYFIAIASGGLPKSLNKKNNSYEVLVCVDLNCSST